MSPGFLEVLRASRADRRDLFVGTAGRMGTTAAYVEKDFWICWTLDVLFNELSDGPRLLFKGGTSLSKAFDLIDRFSEDIDLTIFRGDLGQEATFDQLEALTGKRRRARLDRIRDACASHVRGPLLDGLSKTLSQTLDAAGLPDREARVELDPDDRDRQTMLVHYPSDTLEADAYVRRVVKIESGAKSALDPNSGRQVAPYVTVDLSTLDLRVRNVTTINPERTLWDKIVILHGLRNWYDVRGEVRQEGQRISRHYYDVHQLLGSRFGRSAFEDRTLGIECVRHAQLFFDRPAFRLDAAREGRFTLVPHPGMLDPLRRDYERMSPMIFGPVPSFDEMVASVVELEEHIRSLPLGIPRMQ